MPPNKPASLLCEFALEHVVREPVLRRIQLYRAIAQVIGDEKRATDIYLLASDLEEIERRHRQLRLDLGDDTAGSNGGAAS